MVCGCLSRAAVGLTCRAARCWGRPGAWRSAAILAAAVRCDGRSALFDES
jgi:hypothetical protein